MRHLLHVFPSFQVGGSQRRFAALANHFSQAHRHTVIGLDGCFDAAALLNRDVMYTPLQGPGRASLPKTWTSARHIIKAVKPDLMVTYNWGAMEWSAANLPRLVPHVHIEDGFGPEEAYRQFKRRVIFRRLVLNRHSTLILPSRTLVGLATDVWRIDPARIVYVPNGIPCARFQQSADPSLTATLKGQGPIIGTVATLRREKALDRLITAFAEIRKERAARLVIVGDGPEKPALEDLTVRLELTESVTFTGSITEPERIVPAFDIFAISSDTEQMPLSVLEAMAAGKPIVSTDAGDMKHLLAPENRDYVVAKDSTACASALRLLLDDPIARVRLGDANRRKAMAEFDEQRMFAAYERLFAARPPESLKELTPAALL